jgi:hypothetical protein
MATNPNPYESPRTEVQSTPSFRDSDSEVVELRRRVEELEKRLGRNWLVSRNQYLRILGIWGYLFIGYMLVFFGGWAIGGLIMLCMYLFGSAK